MMTLPALSTSNERSFVQLAGLIGALVAALITGAAVAYRQELMLLPPAVLIAYLIVSTATGRLLFIILGGMFVFQSSDQLSLLKVAYFAGIALAATTAVLNANTWTPRNVQALKPLLNVAIATAAAILLTFIPAHFRGIPVEAWVRDATPYLLGASIPLFAIDAARMRNAAQRAEIILILVGIFAAASFFIEWADRRGLAELPISRLLLPTFAPAAALFYYSLSRTLFAESVSKAWLIVAIAMPLILMMTATRSAIFLVSGVVLLMVVRGDLIGRSSGRLLFALAGALLLVFAAQPVISSVLDVQRLTGRLETTSELLSDPKADRSFAERQAQTNAALNAFTSEPFLGTGVGASIPWSTPWRISASYNIDSSLSILAKFGILGVGLLVAWVIATQKTWGKLRGPSPFISVDFAFAAFLTFLIVASPLMNPIEDKGVSFTILLLLTMLITETREKETTA